MFCHARFCNLFRSKFTTSWKHWVLCSCSLLLGSLSNNDGDGYENATWKSEFALPQTLSRLFQLVYFVKCWQIFLELNSKRLYQSSGIEKESCCLEFPSSTRREIRRFHIVVVQRRQKNVRKSVMHVQSCCFDLLLFCRSRCVTVA